jgi:hypothetical protein
LGTDALEFKLNRFVDGTIYESKKYKHFKTLIEVCLKQSNHYIDAQCKIIATEMKA